LYGDGVVTVGGIFGEQGERVLAAFAEARTTPEQVLESWIVRPDPQVHVAALSELAAQGFTHIFVQAPQEDQERFIAVYGQEVLPAVRRATAGAWRLVAYCQVARRARPSLPMELAAPFDLGLVEVHAQPRALRRYYHSIYRPKLLAEEVLVDLVPLEQVLDVRA
jgi:hypothetical protein